MNKNAKKWVEALRSDKYDQTTGYLSRDGGYCCLGVACDLYAKEHDDFKIDDDMEYVLFDDENYVLPPKVREWLGLGSADGTFYDDYTEMHTLAEENDDGASFDAIADIIESEPEGLFA